MLNREAGFGVGSNFPFAHRDREGLNAGLHHLLMLCWRSMRTGKIFGDGVRLHPVVYRALNVLSDGAWEQDLNQLAKVCGASEAYLSRTFHRQIGIPLSRYRILYDCLVSGNSTGSQKKDPDRSCICRWIRQLCTILQRFHKRLRTWP